MTLKTKSMRAEPSEDDGFRVCIMRKYDPKKPGYYPIDKHWLELSPSEELLRDYHKGLPWEDYVSRFTQEVLTQQADRIKWLAQEALKNDITLLCYEKTPENCHRRLVALACKMYQPSLELILE
ncbi:MAG TPA: DUF488 domain-containing protein [Candidatus Nanoarchaeia archaeon]|nr:DUF488 domain-containing protein [Candidatus Nanoarchaeia archaeon]